MKTQINPNNTILVLQGVVKHLNQQIETNQVLVKNRLTRGLEEFYTKQIISALAKIDYLEALISKHQKDLSLKPSL